MPTITTKRRIACPAHVLFDIVADVEKYPEFVPYCERLIIRERSKDLTDNWLVADMVVSYKLFRETFRSRVKLDKQENIIDVSYISGPFRNLENRWQFKEIDDKTSEILFVLSYEFKSRILSFAAQAVCDVVFGKMIDAFEKRALSRKI